MGTGTPLREFLHVDDLAQAVLLVAENYDSDSHLNVGSGDEISIQNLAQMIANAAGFKGKSYWIHPNRMGHQEKSWILLN